MSMRIVAGVVDGLGVVGGEMSGTVGFVNGLEVGNEGRPVRMRWWRM